MGVGLLHRGCISEIRRRPKQASAILRTTFSTWETIFNIKPGQMSAGAVYHGTEHLVHGFKYGKTFPASSDGTEKVPEKSDYLYAVQVGREQGQSRPAGDGDLTQRISNQAPLKTGRLLSRED
jgi:hypothetical protein